jgi:hypothetical protein
MCYLVDLSVQASPGRADISILVHIGMLLSIALLAACGEPTRPPGVLPAGTSLGIATFAGNIVLETTYGEDTEARRQVRLSRQITAVLLSRLTTELQTRNVRVVPKLSVDVGLLDASQLRDLPAEGWLAHLVFWRKNTYVTAHSLLPLMVPNAAEQLAGTSTRLRAPVLLWATNSYSWNAGGWVSYLPFAKSKWQFSIKSTVKLISARGSILWEESVSSGSKTGEWGKGLNYVVFSHSKITPDQADRVLAEAIREAAAHLATTITGREKS